MNAPMKNRTVANLIEEYEDRLDQIPTAVQSVADAWKHLEGCASVAGKYGGSISRYAPSASVEETKRVLLKSAWRAIYDLCQIDMLAPAADKQRIERMLENPPELTFETAKEQFGDYLVRPRFHILRGLAEVFTGLDDAYKSHSKVKIGVQGLPKRVIVSSVGSTGSYGFNKIRDIINALAAYRGDKIVNHAELEALSGLASWSKHHAGDVVLDGSHHIYRDANGDQHRSPDRGITIKKYQNGNAHVIFDKHTLLDINRALAEFYGEVLPDAEEDDPAKPQSTAVAKDLQFYWTPKKVVDELLHFADLYKVDTKNDRYQPLLVLEPSCGDGRILDGIKELGHKGFGIEVHGGRAHEARMKGHSVLTANFLEQAPDPIYDAVVMNPPFYGKHYVKHIEHAIKFLKPGGTLTAVLPATAHYDHKLLNYPRDRWKDLPAGSFSDAGTNVPTVLYKYVKVS